MLDFDVGKLVVIGVVALIVIGPKDLPRVLRQVGQVVGKMRRMANEFQSQFMDAMREADVENLKKEVESVGDAAKFDVAFDPIKDVKDQITSAVEGDATPAAAEGDAAPDAQAGASSGSLEFDEDARALGLDEHLGELDLEEPPPPPEKLAVESLDEKLEAHDRKIEAPAQDTADAEEARPPTEKRA